MSISNHDLRRTIVPLIGTLALAMAIPSATALAAPSVPAAPARGLVTGVMTMESSVPGLALTSSFANSDGTYTATWESSAGIGTEVQATAPAGTKVTLTQDTTDGVASEVTVTPPPLGKGGAQPMGQPPVLNAWCTDLYMDKVNGKYQAHEHFCDTQYKVVDKGGGDWYILDKMFGTSSNGQDGNYWLWSSYGGDSYPSGNTMVQWAPTGSFHPSACKSYTASLTYGGFSVSVPATYCPNTMDIYTGTLGGQGIEEFWHGCVWPGSVGFNPIDTVHNPPSASYNATLHAYMHLTHLC